jgi:hypothetical protein
MAKNMIFRAWVYFRTGWSMYFAFIFAAINTLTVTYFLAIDKIPTLLNLFPTFLHYVSSAILIGVPFLAIIGYIHYKRSPGYKAEASILVEVHPYQRRTLINSEINLELNLMILNILSKLSNQEKLNHDELNKIKENREKLDNLVNKRTIQNDYDLEYLKKDINKE